MVLIDFANAFNTVSHEILLSILSYLAVSPGALEWFSSYLRGRQQSVRVDECSSDWCELDSGVPQGGILSPLLFSVYINLLTLELHCAYHLYADDLQLYSQAKLEDISLAIDMVNRDLESINTWSKRFGLTVNPLKCQAIIVGSPRLMSRIDTETLPAITFNGTTIPICETVKDLGLHLDCTLSWRKQVTNQCQRVTGTLRALYRLRNFLPPKTKTMLVQTLIFPIIDYGDVCCYDLNADLLDKLDRLLNNCIRFVFNLRQYDHVSALRSQLQWLPIRQRRSLRALTSLLNSPSLPEYLVPHFRFLCSNHDRSLRSTDNLLLLCPSHTTNFINSSFYVQSVLLWNALPTEIRMSTKRLTFKKEFANFF